MILGKHAKFQDEISKNKKVLLLANVAKWTKNPKVKEILEVTYFQLRWKSWNRE